jgi:pSer/pThr/pTyr-binding forkhead associated (FHA) protein
MVLPPTQFVIGRDPECHLRPASPDVSRFHCAIARLGQQVLVRDLKSRNGTLINDERLTDTAKVNDGDVLRIGPLRFQFAIKLGPGNDQSGTSGWSWLMRNPDEKEREALNPSQETLPADFLLPELSEDSRRSFQPEPDKQSGPGSAVAGEFLRDYLSRRKELKSEPIPIDPKQGGA